MLPRAKRRRFRAQTRRRRTQFYAFIDIANLGETMTFEECPSIRHLSARKDPTLGRQKTTFTNAGGKSNRNKILKGQTTISEDPTSAAFSVRPKEAKCRCDKFIVRDPSYCDGACDPTRFQARDTNSPIFLDDPHPNGEKGTRGPLPGRPFHRFSMWVSWKNPSLFGVGETGLSVQPPLRERSAYHAPTQP
ncbi:hypothetical protein CEXT_681201 [Caerostris extrusa]|uniref:Uncharacterized protein n=1 Tax=Caerostris extrusa TaxID=172846 RepID=A0AAV4RF67_CAEEX|nr:hypothetical protein CEXT_681201 [Caerostris extrusa]